MSDSTTLATLTKALSPKTGMQRIPFPTESYQHQSVPLSAKYLLNMYIEQEPSDARSDTALLPNSGAVYRETLGTGPVVAFDTTLVGGFYAVSGGHAFRNANGVTVDLGPVGTPSDPLVNPDHLMTTIACSPSDVVICVPPNAFTAQHGDPTLTQLTDVTHGFPGANSVTFIDGYFVFTQTGRGIQFFWSPLDSPLGPYDALSFANVEGMDNILLRVVTHQGELWFLGYAGIEVWHDVGDKDAPFQRLQGGVIPIGVLPRTVSDVDNSLWWLAPEGIVYRTGGNASPYQATRVSHHAIETELQASNKDTCFALSYVIRGHAVYVLTIADLGLTFGYDAATKRWHNRSSSADGTGPWLALAGGRIGPGSYVGDVNGRLYTLDPDADTDNGVLVLRSVTMPPLWALTNRAFCSRLEVEMEVNGPTPTNDLRLEWSDDGGWTWNGDRIIATNGPLGRRTRAYTTRLGSFRQRVFRFSCNARLIMYAVDADISPGAH